MRSIRSNREMVSALLADYKSQSNTELYDDGLPQALPLENKYENRFESNEIKRWVKKYDIEYMMSLILSLRSMFA